MTVHLQYSLFIYYSLVQFIYSAFLFDSHDSYFAFCMFDTFKLKGLFTTYFAIQNYLIISLAGRFSFIALSNIDFERNGFSIHH